MLATAIRKNTNIKGISVNNVEIKLSQYADDTTLILDGSRESLLSSLAMLDDFSKVSDLRLNDKKRKLYGSAQVLEMIKSWYQEKNLNGQKTRLNP